MDVEKETMNRRLLLCLLLLLILQDSFACLHAYQYKRFPIGSDKAKIVFMECELIRGEDFRKASNTSQDRSRRVQWTIVTREVHYNRKREVLHESESDTLIVQERYEQELERVFDDMVADILTRESALLFFENTYHSHCDYQRSCKLVSARSDTLLNKEFLRLDSSGEEVEMSNMAEFNARDWNRDRGSDLSWMYISSVRMYSNDLDRLVLAHYGSGHEIGMGMRATDSRAAPTQSDDGYSIYIPKESPSPILTLEGIATYREPLMHHGFGIDSWGLL